MSKYGTAADPYRILLVEDNPGDADLMIEAFSRLEKKFVLDVTMDGEEGLDFLTARGKFEDRQSPDLVILDLNLPKMDGREVLKVLKNDENLRHIPVIVFSSSAAERDLVESYALHANCFLTKPVELKGYFEMANDVERFWFGAAKLPARI